MLKRLRSEQPRQSHRYINSLQCAYCEILQKSSGFSPFKLLYGRTVRDQMHILKELLTDDVEESEVGKMYQYVLN